VADLERRLAGGEAPPGAGATEASEEADPEVVRLLREGKEVQALSLVHKQKGASLTEAKAEVDRLKARLSP
jgi:hypothetical protein